MKILFVVLTLLPFLSISQSSRNIPTVDSVEYYQKELGKLWRQNFDSLQKSERFLKLQTNFNRAIQKRNDYTGLVLFSDIAHSDYRSFNSVISQSGFPELKPLSVRVGIGISHKRANTMLDMYFGSIGFGNGSYKDSEYIRTSFSNLFQFDLGFDVFNIERISLYPYGGISLRFSQIKYSKGGQPNPNYTSLSNIRTDENYVRLESMRIGYQYGVGFDYAFVYNKVKTFKTIAFIKAGVNKPFKIDTYKLDGVPD